MTEQGVIDTSVLIHLYQRRSDALKWAEMQTERHFVTTLSWFECIAGIPSRAGLWHMFFLLDVFDLVHFTRSDQDSTIQQMRYLTLRRRTHYSNVLLATLCNRLSVPLYTFNLDEMIKLLPQDQVIRPYDE